jgi:CheY-like chemotaxis protein
MSSTSRDGQPQPPGAPAASPLVLVIEDEADIAELMQIMLEEEGYQVVCHGSGVRGLAAAAELQPRAVVLDLCLQDMDGRKLLHSLRDDPETTHMPVVIASAMTHRLTADDRELVQRVLIKPFGFEELLGAVSSAIEAGPDRSAGRT